MRQSHILHVYLLPSCWDEKPTGCCELVKIGGQRRDQGLRCMCQIMQVAETGMERLDLNGKVDINDASRYGDRD